MSFKLNSQQKKAVSHDSGPLLIIAGAGTGKTRVITQRVAHLINKDLAKSSEILALTFTQKAAQEMQERIDVELPYGCSDVAISTFHSFADRILRQEAVYLGIDPNFALMTTAQEYIYFRNHIFEFSLELLRPSTNPTKFIRDILGHFSRLGDEYISVQEYKDFLKSKKASELDSEIHGIYKELSVALEEYSLLKVKNSRMGFYDVVPMVVGLFKNHASVLDRYKQKYKYILVDEFQDTNYSQNELLKLLSAPSGNITVVGDDDQAIYKFRGAAISNILNFKKSFPSYTKIVLVENYRNAQEILDMSYSLLQKNNPNRLEIQEGVDKRLIRVFPELQENRGVIKNSILAREQMALGLSSDLPKSDFKRKLSKSSKSNIGRNHFANEIDEAEFVATQIKKLVNEKEINYSDVAVLVRANNHADEVINSFKYHGIPFQFSGPKGLYNRPEIKDLISMLHLIVDYRNDTAMYRILSLAGREGSINPREFMDLQYLARKNHLSVFELLEILLNRNIDKYKDVSINPLIKTALKKGFTPTDDDFIDISSGDESRSKLQGLLDSIVSEETKSWINSLLDSYERAFQSVSKGYAAGKVLYNLLVDLGYLEKLADPKSTADEWKAQNINKFFRHLKAFEKESEGISVFDFVDYINYALEIGESPTEDLVDLVEFDGVNILTIHAAKGLEFPVVFMINLVADRFPSRNMSDSLPVPDALIKDAVSARDDNINEERRLFYVGMTRAKNYLYLTSADFYGDGVRKKKQSIFLYDLDLVKDTVSMQNRPNKLDAESLKNIILPDDEKMPPQFRQSIIDNLIHNLSYSHISTYKTCPYQFYLRYFLGIPGMEASSKSFGMTIHNTLKAFYENLYRYKAGLPEVNVLPDKGLLLSLYKNKWNALGYETKEQEEEQFIKGKEMLMNYYKDVFSEDENPVWLEENFRLSLGDFWIRGVVDRLDKTPEGLILFDYKTGAVPKKAIKKDLQIALYSIAIEKLKKEKIVEAYLVYLQGPILFKVSINDKVKEEALKEVKEFIGNVKAFKFKATPGFLCKYCDYKSICDYAL